MKITRVLCGGLLGLVLSGGIAAAVSDTEIKQAIIRESIASYPSVCACPYNVMRNGRTCGGRSAYSKPGGYATICYEADVTSDMVRQYRASHGP